VYVDSLGQRLFLVYEGDMETSFRGLSVCEFIWIIRNLEIDWKLGCKILMEQQVIETIPTGLNSVLLGFHTGLLL
jgi:hypothetical protein